MVRSIPFLILLMLLIPFTRFVVGKSYGATATIKNHLSMRYTADILRIRQQDIGRRFAFQNHIADYRLKRRIFLKYNTDAMLPFHFFIIAAVLEYQFLRCGSFGSGKYFLYRSGLRQAAPVDNRGCLSGAAFRRAEAKGGDCKGACDKPENPALR